MTTDASGGGDAPLRLPTWLQIVLLASLWIVTHPYRGLTHDGRLYTLQALNQLEPGRFAQDLFFKFGSQDSFTAFSALYKPLVALAGPASAHAIATGLGQALWFATLLLLMRALFGRGLAFLVAAAGCICLESYYGGLNIFRYGETFATPRLFAEALVMAAIAGALTRRFVTTGLLLAGAAALHPIMALTGMGFLAILAALHDRRAWILIALGAGGGLLLAMLGVPPFDRVLTGFDPQWLEIVRQRCAVAFVTLWIWPDALRLAAISAVLGAAWLRATPAERPPVVAATLAGAASLLVTLAGADLGHNILVVNAQPWRMLWLSTLVANAWLVLLAWRAPKGWVSRELLIAAALLSAMAGFLPVVRLAASVAALAAVVVLVIEHLRQAPAPALFRIPARVALVLSLLFTGYAFYYQAPAPEFAQLVIRVALFLAALACGAWLAFGNTSLRPAVALLLAVLIGAGLTADQRTAWTRFVEDPTPEPELSLFVGGDQRIYWEDSLELQWFKLHQPAYYSCSQGAGVMFFRETAIEFRRRGEALQSLNSQDFREENRQRCGARPSADLRSAPSVAPLAAACRKLADLDAIVLFNPVPGARAAAIWSAPIPRMIAGDKASDRRASRPVTRYYKYDCTDFRTAAPRR